MNIINSRYTFLLLLLAFLFNSVNAVSISRYSFRNHSINNGLSQNTVHRIFQDNLGFMWFATKDGLNRFDGATFRVFRFSPDDELHNNVFRRILQDKTGNIWVTTEHGIYSFDPRFETFTRFNRTTENGMCMDGVMGDFILDEVGDLWFSVLTKGVFHYSFETDQLTFYAVITPADGIRMISLAAGNNKDVWAFPFGLPAIRIDKTNGQMTELRLTDDPDFFFDLGEVRNVAFDDYNWLVAATSQRGLVAINIDTNTHRILLDEDEWGKPIFVRTWARIDPQTIWVGTESGIYILNTETGSVVNLRQNSFIALSLSDNAIYSLYQDWNGGIWIGSYFGGVDYYSPQFNKFELFYPLPHQNSINGLRVREFFPSSDGNIWIGTEDNGLNLFDPVTATFLPLPMALRTLYSNIHALYEDDNYLWISTFAYGLNKYNRRTGHLVTYWHSDDPASISHNSTFSLIKDQQGKLWAATLSGLNTYDYETNRFTRIDMFQGMALQAVFEDRDGMIWVASFNNGLYRYNPKTEAWTHFVNERGNHHSLPHNTVTSVYEDSKRRLWVTTRGGGFSLLNKEDETFTTFNSANGLVNDVVYQIIEDNYGVFWVTTNAGLVRVDPNTHTFRRYSVNNGLMTNQFNYQSSLKTPDGMLYFGSINGFIRFNPSTLMQLPMVISPIVLTELLINNQPVTPTNKRSPLQQSILFSDAITLTYSQNTFSIRYAVLNFNNSESNHILYKLEGFDRDWIEAYDLQPLVYSNLHPGRYNLMLKLNNSSAAESEIKILAIRIRSPFYLSPIMIVLYILLLFLAGYSVCRFFALRNQRQRQQEMNLFEQEKEREQYQQRIDFFTNVAHEIRTPLSLIKAPLDHVLMTEEVSKNVEENLQIMSQNTDRLLSLTSQLLDFRKTEADAYQLTLKTQNISKLLRETKSRFLPTAQRRNLRFDLLLPEHDLYAQVDKEAFLKIITNLFSNAVKYCDSYVYIRAALIGEEDNMQLQITTENDGEAIPEKFKEEIFKPFVHFDKERDVKIDGTGIGLALAHSLTELHNGKLTLEEVTECIRFQLIIPVGKTDTESMAATVQDEEQKELKPMLGTTILLVDDDKELLMFEEKCLSLYYNVLIAENGKQALNVLSKNIVNLIVSDVMMPEMDGFELVECMKSNIEFSHIPIILLTAKVNVQAKVQGYESGADAYLEKPFSVEMLVARIANLLKNREKLRETFLKHPFIGANSLATNKRDEAFIRKLHEVVKENISNPDFAIEGIAEKFHMSRASFYRKIKGTLDLTPNEYIRVERLKEAARLLREKEYKINEISRLVGFRTTSYFTKCFHQQFGVPPKEFE